MAVTDRRQKVLDRLASEELAFHHAGVRISTGELTNSEVTMSTVTPTPVESPRSTAKEAKQAVRTFPCVHLGKMVKRAGCAACPRDDARQCDAGLGVVTQNGLCESCELYEADDPTATDELMTSSINDPKLVVPGEES